MSRLVVQRHPLWDVMNDGRPYEPLPWQNLHVHARENIPNLILACGRRSGKSFAVKAEIIKEVMRPQEEVMGVLHAPVVYVIGPTSELAMRVFEPIWDLFVPSDSGSYTPPLGFLHQWHDKARGVIQLVNGARIYRKTGDDPRSMQGERVTLAVSDETQDMPEDVWEKLLPSLADSGGRLIAIGVTAGKGRFRSWWHRGQGSDPNFYSASVPTTVNPMIAKVAADRGYYDVDEYIREVLAPTYTEREVRQQFYAEWTDDDGFVFKGFEDFFTFEPPTEWEKDDTGKLIRPKGTHIMGLDVAKKNDFTVGYVVNVGELTFVDQDRFNQLPYEQMAERVASLYHKWGCKFIHMDNTGIGEAMADLLRSRGCSIVPFNFSNETKARLISRFAAEISRGNVTFLKNDDILMKEMTLYEATLSGVNTIKYGAPVGYHDDCVTAAALAVYKAAVNRNMARSPVNKPYVSFAKHVPLHERMPVRMLS